MLSIMPYDLTNIGLKKEDDRSTKSILWTGRNSQLCAQHFRSAADLSYPLHAHSEYTLFVCLAGEVLLGQLGQEQTLRPGEAAIINAGVLHYGSYRAAGAPGCEAVAIALRCESMAALTADFKLPHWRETTCPLFTGKVQDPVLLGCAREIALELKNVQPGQGIVIENLVSRLLIQTVRLWPAAGISSNRMDLSPRLSHGEFVRAYDFMRLCRKENFRLEKLCAFLGMSEERFARLFVASTDQTPANFYNRLLIEQAAGLLTLPKRSIKEIGFDLGFRTSSHFNVSFRRVYGVSPQRYREQHLVTAAPSADFKPARCF